MLSKKKLQNSLGEVGIYLFIKKSISTLSAFKK